MVKLARIYEACAEVAAAIGSCKNLLVTRTTYSVTILTSDRSIAPVQVGLLFNLFCGYLTCLRKRALIRRQVILHTVSSIESLLAPFDVDCCAVAYDVSSNQLWASPRAMRAFRHGANVVDSRFNSGNYISRLHKYSGRGFAVVVPGFEPWLCLLYTSPSPRDATLSRMPSSA